MNCQSHDYPFCKDDTIAFNFVIIKNNLTSFIHASFVYRSFFPDTFVLLLLHFVSFLFFQKQQAV